MKTKQVKEESEKNIEEETIAEPKTRARKKASDSNEDDKTKPTQDEPKPNKEPKKNLTKTKTIIKKKPLGIRKTLRNKKVIVTKDKLKNVIKQVKRGRKPGVKSVPSSAEKDSVPLIPDSEIKKEPIEDTTSNSRSSSPKTTGRRPRLSSDMVMLKSVLGDNATLTHGTRTSPYSMRSERSNSPSQPDGKNLRSGKPRKVKKKLLNEVVIKEQKKRRRLLSDSKIIDSSEGAEEKKLKRGRSCSRDGSEISKCSDVTESDISLNDTLSNDADSKELNKKLDKPKTDLDVDIENNLQISTIEKVPSLIVDSKSENKIDTESASSITPKTKKKMSLKRSTSIDSDNNNSSNRLIVDTINNILDIEEKANLLWRTESDTLVSDRSSILNSMSKTFNSKEVSKYIRKARRGRKAAVAGRSASSNTQIPKPLATSTVTNDSLEEKQESLETLSKKIDDLISNLDALEGENNIEADNVTSAANSSESMTKSVSKFYGVSKPLGDNNTIVSTPDTIVKEKETIALESTPTKNDDSENIRLHYDDDSVEKSADHTKREIPYKCSTVASIDKLMDRLKEFEEFDKKRQRQESESKSSDSKQVMVTNDVVLIPKSGADIKPLKDIQSVRSPEKPVEKGNVLSCFENNSAISIVKRDTFRKSVDIDLPNSVTLIKRNNISRKESTSSNPSKESSDAISIFEKSFGKDVTLTEIRKSVDKSATTQVDLHQFATLHPNNSTRTDKHTVAGVVLDSKQISITPRMIGEKSNSIDIIKRLSRDSTSRKSSESGNDLDTEKLATIEKIKSPIHSIKSPSILSPIPMAMKSPESVPMETEPLAPPLENIKVIPEDILLTTEIPMIEETKVIEKSILPEQANQPASIITDSEIKDPVSVPEEATTDEKAVLATETPKSEPKLETKPMEVSNFIEENKETVSKISEAADEAKPGKSPEKVKPIRTSVENQPGPSNILLETPESQKRKESVLRTLGLLTHQAANEAKLEKQKEKERLYNKKSVKTSGDYTGTLKTVIKLNRSSGERERKKYRSSLKMTFQKSKNRSGKIAVEQGEAADADDAYYTIERREGGAATDGGHRKSHYSNRLNNHDGETTSEQVAEPAKEPTQLNLVIPEKASSFSIHPGRLCMDQCFYCGGKFGLFDTPCHIAQMKSADRQKKVLHNEEKLTIDSCLCDACYRHVDRRANCPSYRKRPAKQPLPPHYLDVASTQAQQPEKPLSPPLDEESEEESPPTLASGRAAICHTEGCSNVADHSIRRKWLIKMREPVTALLKLEGDYPGLHTIPLCGDHHRLLAPLLACALCRRRLTKHHNVHFIHHGYTELNPLLAAEGLPVQFLTRPALCKPCRYYCVVLQRPGTNDGDVKSYRRRLLQIHNVQIPPDLEKETEEDNNSLAFRQKKKMKTKSKQRKSTDDKAGENDEKAERTSESSQESEKIKEDSNDSHKANQPLEEDIESLISSNKIMVPGNKSSIEQGLSDCSESETVMDMEGPLLPLDKQTELQYLLQKQNNPAQFLHKANLTQKQRNIMKMQSMAGVQKVGQQHRIHDKNAKRIQKLGQIVTQKDKADNMKEQDMDTSDSDKSKDGTILKNSSANEECTVESVAKKPADITTLKSKWQMSESFTQVKKNLSELSKKLTIDNVPKKLSDMKYSNPVKRLETNPSISVRELFPGEEEMNLQCNIEFNNVKGVTPEGWEKCNSTIQYDTETKKLWTELQRPYGNQSSFLRHLVLLEKYFRSGDLVLSNNASPQAANYSDSVQSRLRAYDNVVTDAPRRNEPSISLIEFRKQKKPLLNGKSLLKSNQTTDKPEPKKPTMPPPVLPKKSKDPKNKSKALPPELIAINVPNSEGRSAIRNVLHNIQQLVKGVSASDPTEVAAAPLPLPKLDPPKEKKEAKSDTPKKQRTTSKPWRPTLMPITPENVARISREPRQTAVDGRSLPSLVQVMSSGKRYHITLQDYNKMCIMRREKLQQLQDGDPKTKRPSIETETLVTEIHPSTMLGNGATIKHNVEKPQDTDKQNDELSQMGNAVTILKNVGLKNITIAPIPAKTATITSHTASPTVSSPSSTSTTMKIPQLGPSVSITSETVLTPQTLCIATTSNTMIMPKIPKSLTVIPQAMIPSFHQVPTVTNVLPSQAIIHTTTDGQRP